MLTKQMITELARNLSCYSLSEISRGWSFFLFILFHIVHHYHNADITFFPLQIYTNATFSVLPTILLC